MSSRLLIFTTVFLLVAMVAVAGLAVADDGPVVGPGTTFEASDDGPTVTINEELELDDPFFYPDEFTVDLSPYATFVSDGNTSVNVTEIDGEFTDLRTYNISAALTIDPHDKQAVTIQSDSMNDLRFTDVDTDDSEANELLFYGEGTLHFTLTELPAEETVEATDLNTGETIDTVTTDSNGVATFELESNSHRSVNFAVPAEPEPEPEPEPDPDPEANFEVSITDTNSPVEPGQTIQVNVEIHNTGDLATNQDIEFSVRDHSDSEEIFLGSDETETLTFEWATTADDLGSHTATVSSADDSANTTVSVSADAPVFLSGHVADATPDVVDFTLDQDVTLEAVDPTAGFSVSIDGVDVDLEDATAVGSDVALELAIDVEANQDVVLAYDGQSDNVLNEHGIEAHAFETDDIDNRVIAPLVAHLAAYDPTIDAVSERISIDVAREEGVRLSAADSQVPPGVDVSYEWQIGDDTFTTDEPELTQQFDELGTYQATVTVHAGDRSDSALFEFEIVDETPPIARLTADDPVFVGDDPNFDASESEDNVGIAEFQWDFGDGTTDSGEELTQPAHTYDEPGTYDVTVTVIDTSGNEATNETTVIVEEVEEDDDRITDVGARQTGIGLLILVLIGAGLGYWYLRRRNAR